MKTERSSKKISLENKNVTRLHREMNDLDTWYIHKTHILRSFLVQWNNIGRNRLKHMNYIVI